MLKLLKVLLIVGIFITAITNSYCYEPLTDEEVLTYWNSLTLKEQIEEIRKLDILEHIPLQFEIYRYYAILDKDGLLTIFPDHSPIQAKHGYLVYEIHLPVFYMENFTIPVKKNYILSGIVGGVIGVFGTAIAGEDIWWKYCMSGVGGISIGILMEYLFR